MPDRGTADAAEQLADVAAIPARRRRRTGVIVQNESPGKDKEANWLPAPKGPFSIIMRLYWPKEEAMDRKWTAPPLKKVA